MYPWMVFLHVLSAFIFMLAHGATATVMFRLRDEREPERLRGLLALRQIAEKPFFISSTLMFLTGVALGFMGGWWRSGWIWSSLGLLIAISIVMGIHGRSYLDRVTKLVDAEPAGNPHSEEPDASELEAALTAGRPGLMTAVGVGGFIVILWLMMFKPF